MLEQILANAQAVLEIRHKVNADKSMRPDGSYLKILN